MKNADKAASAADRIVSKTDNAPPEALPMQLANASELDTMIKATLDDLTNEAVLELATYARVPDAISDDDVYQRVTTLAARMKELFDKVDAKKGEFKRPYLDATQLLDNRFKLLLSVEGGSDRQLRKELEAAHKGLKGLLSDYDTKKYQAEQAAIEAERQRIAAAAAADGIEMADAPAATAMTASVKSAHGGQSVRKVVTEWRVTDESLLPRNVLSVDSAKVQALIDQGATSIPGIIMEKKVETHVKR